MERDGEQMTVLARETARVAAELERLTGLMDAASFYPDGLPSEVLRGTVSTLRGAAMRAAMCVPGDAATALLSELEAGWRRTPDPARAPAPAYMIRRDETRS